MQKKIFACYLKRMRQQIGKTQVDGANFVGITQSQYCRIENTGIIPRERIGKFAEFLRVSTEELSIQLRHQVVYSQEQDLVPLIKCLAQCPCGEIYMEDIEFLLEIQSKLDKPLTSEVIVRLMRLRRCDNVPNRTEKPKSVEKVTTLRSATP